MIGLLKGVFVFFAPLFLSYAGGKLMAWISGRPKVDSLHIANNAGTPLNLRLYGYDVHDVAAHWAPFSPVRLQQERCFLELDLVYPFLYGGAFLAALLLARAWLERPLAAHWLVFPVVLAVLADWVENLVQLHQLRRWTSAAEPAVTDLNATLIQLASAATSAKIWLLLGILLLLAVLAVWVIFTPSAGPPQSAHP